MISDLLRNHVLWVALAGWCAAEVLKTIIYWIVNKELDLSRLVGDGGYPSAHSALVTALAASCAKSYGLDSFQFAVTAIIAVIVMHDAHGVRLETGRQARTINSILEIFKEKQWVPLQNDKLKETIGHTPLQVFSGAVLGAVIALLL